MAFKGLFIGIDRYRSSDINCLTCAARDAIALEALFADTFGGTTTLLTDEAATRTRIIAELEALALSSPDDIVVVSFSGHGSETHELVACDTEVGALRDTGLHLDDLLALFVRIPAKHLVLFLDCCFSGGVGAKVLHVDAVPRDLKSTEARLAALSGTGRWVVTASAADEEAWENPRVGHGFFTHFLLEALQGPPALVEQGKIALYRLLEFVSRQVSDAAQRIGRTQRPTFRGKLDGEIFWPVLAPGARYFAAFPHRSVARAQPAVASLAPFGFSPATLKAWSQAVPALNQLQLDAINDYGVLQGAHLVVVAPTSSGKTMIGELAALKSVAERQRAIFLLPLKALVADKRRHFEAVYGPLGLRTIEATGETDDITPLLRGRYDVALLTYEKFAAIALSCPHVLAQVGTIVVDEAQMLADKNRGANLEFLLTVILSRRKEGIEPQLIALSGVVGNTNGLERWLGGKLLRRDERPVPLDEGVLCGDGCHRFISSDRGAQESRTKLIQRGGFTGKNRDWVVPLVAKLLKEGQQVIVFRETKSETRFGADYLAEDLGLPPANAALARLPQGDPSRASQALRKTLAGGVAFHNADLDREERRVIEEEFRSPRATLRVIVATTTLAMGINTPANSVVIVGLMHPGDEPYSVAEYKNLVGRAGRLGYTARGASYLVAPESHVEHGLWKKYVTGQPEDLASRFLADTTDPRSLVVRVLAASRRFAKQGISAVEVGAFLEGSFGAFQQKLRHSGWSWSEPQLRGNIAELERHALIERAADGRLSLTPLGLVAGETTTEVASVINLVACLRSVSPDQLNEPTLIAAIQATVELDGVYMPVNTRSTFKEPQAWTTELVRQGVPSEVLRSLGRGVREQREEVMRKKRAVACLLYVSGREMTELETTLTQFGGAFDVAGAIRGVAARTSDLLPAATRIAQLLHPTLDVDSRRDRLATRLTFGVAGPAAGLAALTGDALRRGDYRRLVAAELTTVPALSEASDQAILACVEDDPLRLAAVRRATKELERRAVVGKQAAVPLYAP